jgi:hypothetical protein
MRSLLELLPTQQIIDKRLQYTSYSPILLEIKQQLAQYEDNAIEYAYNTLQALAVPYSIYNNSIFEISRYLSDSVSVNGPRSMFSTILCSAKNLDKIQPARFNNTVDSLLVKWIESDLPNQDLVILSYSDVNNTDAGIILGTDRTNHVTGLLIRPDYKNYFKVLEIK